MNSILSKIVHVVILLAPRALVVFWLALNFDASDGAIAKSQNAEWILVQDQTERGENTVYVSANAVKFVSKQWQYQLLAKAPDWKVHCFRPVEKVEWTGSLDRFDGDMMSNPFCLPSKNTAKLNVEQPGTMLGLRCTRYLELPKKRTVMWAADDIAIAPKAAEFMCRYLCIPQIVKLPLRRVKNVAASPPTKKGAVQWMDWSLGEDLRSGIQIDLNTKSCKQVAFKSSDFDCPTGYKQVPQVERVAFSRKMKDDLEILGDDIGFATRTGSKSNKSGAK